MANEIIQTGKTIFDKQIDEGQVTAAGAGVLTVTDTSRGMAVNQYAGFGIRIISGTGAGSSRRIISNTATVFTCDAVLTTGLDSRYIILNIEGSIAPIGAALTNLKAKVIAGYDGGAVRVLLTDAAGKQTNQSETAPAAAIGTLVTVVGGSDGGTTRAVAVDAAGRAENQSDAAPAAAIPAEVTVVGGSDGGTTRAVAVDAAGRAENQSDAAPAAAIPAEVTVVGGSDGGTTRSIAVNASGEVKTQHNITGIADGRKVVAVAGTAETLVAGSTPCKKVNITAEVDNTLAVVVGGSTVVAALATRRGMPLLPGESTGWFEIDDLLDIYLNAIVAGEGVTYIYLT